MIVLFTSNISGGMIQFAVQLLIEIRAMHKESVLFVPHGATISIPAEHGQYLCYYDKIKSVNTRDGRIRDLASKISSYKPDVVWFTDNGILSAEVGLNLCRDCKQVFTLHDAGGSHPTNDMAIKDRLKRAFRGYLSLKFENKTDFVLVVSNESRKKYIAKCPQNEKKTVTMTLGAHIPQVSQLRPEGIIDEKYLLFFGRIDKYKGIINILKAYQKYDGKLHLVIAGKGTLSDEELQIAAKDRRVCLLNRYITDEEMLWLFAHAEALVLPYIEATQSGIIPIAYSYGKPVLVSDVEGLTQFVEDEKTGYICRNNAEYVSALYAVTDKAKRQMIAENVIKYYQNNMDWKSNISRLLSFVGISE